MGHLPGTFTVDTRPYGDSGKHRSFVVIKCSTCPREDAKVGHSAGWGPRMFPDWLLGRHGGNADQCPDCKRAKRQVLHPTQPAVAAQKVVKNLIEAAPPPASPPANTVMRDKLTEAVKVADEKPATTPHIEKTAWPLSYRRGQRGPLSSTINFATRKSAAWAAYKYMQLKGVSSPSVKTHYKTAQQPDGKWMWWPTTHLPPVLPQPEPAPAPVVAKEPEPMARIEDPKPATTIDTSTVVRTPTRDERRAVQVVLDTWYDMDAQRYRGNQSDQTLATQLDVPRKWVTDLRMDLYGDHDRNEASEQQAKKLDEAIELADRAVARLLEMAAEAEKIGSDLKLARTKLG